MSAKKKPAAKKAAKQKTEEVLHLASENDVSYWKSRYEELQAKSEWFDQVLVPADKSEMAMLRHPDADHALVLIARAQGLHDDFPRNEVAKGAVQCIELVRFMGVLLGLTPSIAAGTFGYVQGAGYVMGLEDVVRGIRARITPEVQRMFRERVLPVVSRTLVHADGKTEVQESRLQKRGSEYRWSANPAQVFRDEQVALRGDPFPPPPDGSLIEPIGVDTPA